MARIVADFGHCLLGALFLALFKLLIFSEWNKHAIEATLGISVRKSIPVNIIEELVILYLLRTMPTESLGRNAPQ